MRKLLLGEIATVTMGQSPPGESCNGIGEGIPLLNGPTEFGPHQPVPVQYTKDPRKRAKPGDILFCVRGSTTGRMNWADREYAIGRGLAAIRHKKGDKFQPFLRGLVEYRLPELLAQATGSTFPNVSYDQIIDLLCDIPPESQQLSIAEILKVLDDKIELNRKANETLEAMARAIFKSWFVDFDPVRAKMEGRQPAGMDAATAALSAEALAKVDALFPDSYQDSPMGDIPKGWGVRSLDKMANFLNGITLQKYPPKDGPTFPVIKIAQLRKGDSEGADRCNTEVPNEYIVKDGDVLFSWSGSLEVELWCSGPGALNQHLFKVTSEEFPKWFYYLWTHHYLADFRRIAAGKATTMGHIQRRHLTNALAAIPPRALLEFMTRIMTPLIDSIIINRINSLTIAAIRDALLPKLMSGDLRIANSA